MTRTMKTIAALPLLLVLTLTWNAAYAEPNKSTTKNDPNLEGIRKTLELKNLMKEADKKAAEIMKKVREDNRKNIKDNTKNYNATQLQKFEKSKLDFASKLKTAETVSKHSYEKAKENAKKSLQFAYEKFLKANPSGKKVSERDLGKKQ